MQDRLQKALVRTLFGRMIQDGKALLKNEIQHVRASGPTGALAGAEKRWLPPTPTNLKEH